ncbi:MAG TPA: glutaredoxin family protein [Burkholderiales bacterium]|nr:glutaredoxin family protein [Burkholderiales bacterium]
MPTEHPPTLTVYSRAYCHLCEDMIEALRSLQGLVHFEVAVVDVDSDPELERRHGEKVPVLMHGELELCHYRLDAAAVTAFLKKIR